MYSFYKKLTSGIKSQSYSFTFSLNSKSLFSTLLLFVTNDFDQNEFNWTKLKLFG